MLRFKYEVTLFFLVANCIRVTFGGSFGHIKRFLLSVDALKAADIMIILRYVQVGYNYTSEGFLHCRNWKALLEGYF